MKAPRFRSLARPTGVLAVLVGLGTVAVTGCGSKAGEKSASGTAVGTGSPVTTSQALPRGPGEVLIHDYDFSPTTGHGNVGTTITWTNTDVSDHWVISAPASPEAFDLGRQRTGASVTHTFTAPGSYPYYCKLHNYMKGTVVVS